MDLHVDPLDWTLASVRIYHLISKKLRIFAANHKCLAQLLAIFNIFLLVFVIYSFMQNWETPEYSVPIGYEPNAFSNDSESLRIFKLADANVHKTSGILLLAFCNSGMIAMAANWIISLHRNSVEQFLIMSFDEEFVDQMVKMGLTNNVALIPQSWLIAPVPQHQTKWGSAGYLNLMRSRIAVISRFIDRGYTVFHNDVDIVWLSPHIFAYLTVAIREESEVIYMADFEDDINPGCIVYKPGQKCKFFMSKFMEFQQTYPDDMLALKMMQKRLAIRQQLISIFQPLEKSLFGNGPYQYKKIVKMGIKPLLFHATWTFGQKNKISLLKRLCFWYLDSS